MVQYVILSKTFVFLSYFQVFRPSKDNLNQFMLIDQLEFSTQAPGEYTVDMMSIDNARWHGRGMAVKKGDVIGFYCPGQQIIMYDKDETVNQTPLCVEPREPFDNGSTLTFRPVDVPFMRAYSLNAIIIPGKWKELLTEVALVLFTL